MRQVVDRMIRTEQLGMYQCNVWKEVKGARVTYRWIDEDGVKRWEVYHSTRPSIIEYKVDGSPYVKYCGARFDFSDFLPCTPLKLDDATFTYAAHDTAFSGYLIAVVGNGESCYVARSLS